MEIKFAIDKRKIFRILVCAVTPFAYAVNPYLLLVMVFLQLGLFCTGKDFDDDFCIMFLLANLYPSISLGGFKVYDLIIVLMFIALMLRIRGHLFIKPEGVIYFFIVLFIGLYHGESREVTEVLRYFISMVMCFMLISMQPSLERLKDRITEIIICNIYNAIVVYALLTRGVLGNYLSSAYSVNLYEYSNEIRLNGFFSDPNKYMTFCFTLILLIELFWENEKRKTLAITLLCVSSVISRSRTSILIVFVYLFIKLLIWLYQSDKKAFLIVLSAFVVVALALTANMSFVEKVANDFFVWSARALGRTRTLEINQNITQDNRIVIWRKAMNLIKEHPIAGYGWAANEVLLPYPTHNTVLSLMLDGGIVAVISYVFVMKDLIFNSKWALIIPLIVIPLLTLDMGSYRLYFFALGLIWRYPDAVRSQSSYRLSGRLDEEVWN